MAAALERVCIIGSGNWGSAVARIIGANGALRRWRACEGLHTVGLFLSMGGLCV